MPFTPRNEHLKFRWIIISTVDPLSSSVVQMRLCWACDPKWAKQGKRLSALCWTLTCEPNTQNTTDIFSTEIWRQQTHSHLKAGFMPILSGCGRAGVRLLGQGGGGKSFWYWESISRLSWSTAAWPDSLEPFPDSFPPSFLSLLLVLASVPPEDMAWHQLDLCWLQCEARPEDSSQIFREVFCISICAFIYLSLLEIVLQLCIIINGYIWHLIYFCHQIIVCFLRQFFFVT